MRKLNHLFIFILLFGALGILFTACPGPQIPVDPVIYVAGYYNDGDHDVAAYWTDGTRTDLTDGTANARANSIYVYDGDVYVAGYYNDGTRETAAYWKNGGSPIEFTSGSEDRGEAEDIFVDSNGVYVAGFYSTGTNETIWYNDDGVETPLINNNSEAKATGISVKNGVVYVSGYYADGVYPYVATYWKDGTKITPDLFPEKSQGLDIFVTDSDDVYVSGLYYDSGEANFGSSYWLNDETGHAPLYSAGLSFANAIKVDSGTVYSAGFYPSGTDMACYWENGGSPIDLEPGRSNDIWVESNSVYVVGNYFDGDKNIAAIWENGTRRDLYNSEQNGVHAGATSIFLD
jgi:hypothetical protein